MDYVIKKVNISFVYNNTFALLTFQKYFITGIYLE